MKTKLAVWPALMILGLGIPSGILAQAADPPQPDTVIYQVPRGTVTFTHGRHAELAECRSCHHESKPEKPQEYEYQKCSACHQDPAVEPVKTSHREALHDTTKREGICYNCHKEEIAKGTERIPTLCGDCHKRKAAGSQRP